MVYRALYLILLSAALVRAESTNATRNVEGIQDNSFFVEEAYNQEPGIVQHILTGAYRRDRFSSGHDWQWTAAFTQEWPLFGQTHQLSYTVPYHFNHDSAGVGDVLLNYRYQVFLDKETLTGFAPRFSLILPTGDEDKGFGDGTVGYQVNLPFSTTLGDKWFAHANAGVTWLPSAAAHPDRDLIHYNLGASAIYAATRDLHVLLEWIGGWEHDAETGRPRKREFASLISPGLRKAFNFPGTKQLVVGVAAPFGLTDATPDFGVFLYLSFEHAFLNAKEN